MSDSTFRSDAGGGARDKIREKAADLAGGAKDAVRGQYQRAMGGVVGELNSLASALRNAGDHIQGQNQSQMAVAITSKIADRITSFADTLDGRDLDEVLGNIHTFARRNPAAFVGGAAVIGFLAARFAKSSAAAVPAMALHSSQQPMQTSGTTDTSFHTGTPSAYGTAANTGSYGTGAPASEYGTGTGGSGVGPGSTGSTSGRT